jgi:hypothetical protein
VLIIHPFSACWFKGRVLALKARGAGKKSKVKGKKGVSGAKPSKAIPASPLSIAYLEWIVCIFPGKCTEIEISNSSMAIGKSIPASIHRLFHQI